MGKVYKKEIRIIEHKEATDPNDLWEAVSATFKSKSSGVMLSAKGATPELALEALTEEEDVLWYADQVDFTDSPQENPQAKFLEDVLLEIQEMISVKLEQLENAKGGSTNE